MHEDRYDEFLGLAADSGWAACTECGQWQPTSGMVEVSGWLYCPTHRPQPATLDRAQVVETLAGFRRAWEVEADGEDLLHLPIGVGYVLGDLVMILGLTPDEQTAVLGPELCEAFHRAIS